jgi:hypothetical protein
MPWFLGAAAIVLVILLAAWPAVRTSDRAKAAA